MSNTKRSAAITCGRFLALLATLLLPACGSGGSPGGNASGDLTVGSSSPSNNATNVPTSTNGKNNVVTGKEVTASFSQPMDPATINSSPAGTVLTFTLRETTGNNVPGTVTMNAAEATMAANTVATFTPTASALTPNTSYTATVTTSAKNVGGIAMAKDVSWSFSTSAVAFIAQAPVDLGMACDYAIFADTGIANATAPAAITGNMGVGPGVTSTAITGPWALNLPAGSAYSTSDQVVGKVYAFDYAPPTPSNVTTTSTDMLAAYNDAAGRMSPDGIGLGGGSLDGLIITPGLYRWNTDVTLSVGATVTLFGGPADVWIFQITGTLATGANSNISLTGGAQASNVFWQVAGSSVAMGANSHFEGTVLAKYAINLVNQASVTGRLLAQTAVNLDENTINGSPCPCGSPTTARAGGSASPSSTAKNVSTATRGHGHPVTAGEETATFNRLTVRAMVNSSPAKAVLTFTLDQDRVPQPAL
jgi:hypothetical protein